ncbi:unnamed protein product [Phyllotreta striolata]|uniref:Uncharacterized protein n=1 Tax=Phyllotreta striolata TaxID=444603 RepID=A0A9N9TRG5_PHYSR|nr:unnamed protein product [Phyllotreta striolata]
MCYRIALVLIPLIALSNCCPFPCICRWKNGKQTAECVNKDLLVIPEGLDTEIQVLEFSGNNLRALHREKFLKLDLINLQRIHLSRCRISHVNGQTFKGLTNLVELDLSENLLEAIPSESFKDCTSLMRLSLSRNPIKSLDQNAFRYLSTLSTLELSNCDISTVHREAFFGLYSLEWLHLESNKMKSFPASSHVPETLKGIQLQGNPWHCDCHLLDFQEFLFKYTYPLSNEPLCKTPSTLSGRKIKSIPKVELACLPEIIPTTFFLEIDEGKNISLVCQVRAIPEAAVNWYFEGQLLQNDTFLAPELHLLYYVEQGTENKRSELFIYNANSEDSGTFICNAENSAGVSHANYTIRVLLKQEPKVEANEIPFEFILIVISATSAFVLLLLTIGILALLKCRRTSHMKRKRYDSKLTLGNSTGESVSLESPDSMNQSKNSTFKLVNYDELKVSSVQSETDRLSFVALSQLPKNYSERNPDIINGTEIIENSDSDIITTRQHSVIGNVRFAQMTDPCASECSLFFVHRDTTLHPVVDCYRTLPNKRRSAAATPLAGVLSREAEFLNRNSAAQSPYEYFGSDVRYTADGYPVKATDKCQQAVIIPSHPDSHKSSSETLAGEQG